MLRPNALITVLIAWVAFGFGLLGHAQPLEAGQAHLEPRGLPYELREWTVYKDPHEAVITEPVTDQGVLVVWEPAPWSSLRDNPKGRQIVLVIPGMADAAPTDGEWQALKRVLRDNGFPEHTEDKKKAAGTHCVLLIPKDYREELAKQAGGGDDGDKRARQFLASAKFWAGHVHADFAYQVEESSFYGLDTKRLEWRGRVVSKEGVWGGFLPKFQ